MKTRINIPRVPTEPVTIEDIKQWQENAEEDAMLTGFLVAGEEVSEESFYKLDASAGRLERCRFLDCDFEKSSFVDVIFENCDFSNSRFGSAYFGRCEFHHCKCLGTDFHEAVFKHVRLVECQMRYANLSGTLFENVHMQQCDFTEAALRVVKYKRWDAEGSKFYGTNFFQTILAGFDFSENEMGNIIVSDDMKELRGCKISPVQAMEVAKLLEIDVV
ncbi:MAG: pentapeptide repeat-containing protein [Hespellia sp.]|nr:pentapeptide repeat-containing protein [Hespellia sp.]